MLLFYWFLFALGFAVLVGAVYMLVVAVNKFANRRRTVPRPYVIIWLTLSLTWLGIMIYGYFVGRWELDVRNFRINLYEDQLPDTFDGYKIIMFSDLHIDGWADHPGKLQHIVDEINRADADLVCFGGDLVSNNFHELTPMASILGGIKARDGVYAVLGNYDYARYSSRLKPELRQSLADTLVMEMQNMGWNVLLNDRVQIRRGNDSIVLVGMVTPPYGTDTLTQKDYLLDDLAGIDSTEFTVLLVHDPTIWRGMVRDSTSVDLMLSGHTPAWQLRVGGFTPAEFLSTQHAGWYHHNRQHIFVSVGLGSRMRFRIGAIPEIAVITLRNKKQ